MFEAGCRLVAAFRKWLDMRAGGGPPTKLPKELPPLVDRQEVFLNRYEQHTKHCPYCSTVSWRAHTLITQTGHGLVTQYVKTPGRT